jgi:hypothetical protein
MKYNESASSLFNLFNPTNLILKINCSEQWSLSSHHVGLRHWYNLSITMATYSPRAPHSIIKTLHAQKSHSLLSQRDRFASSWLKRSLEQVDITPSHGSFNRQIVARRYGLHVTSCQQIEDRKLVASCYRCVSLVRATCNKRFTVIKLTQ